MGINAIEQPRVTMEFADGQVSWSESHYYNGTPSALTDPALLAAMAVLCKKRAECLEGGVQFLACKVSLDTINRDVNYLTPPGLPVPNAAGYYAGSPQANVSPGWTFQSPHLSWPIKMVDDNNSQIAIVYVAGMPASITQNGPGPYQATAQTPGSYLASYANQLQVGPWGAAARKWPAPLTSGNSTPITAFTYIPASASAPTQLQFTVAAAGNTASLAPGVWVRIGGMKYTTPQGRIRLNGSYQVTNYFAGVATVNVPRVKIGPAVSAFGYMQSASYVFSKYVSFTLNNITHRKRGGSVGKPRGRR